VLSGTGICEGLITSRVESYQLWCVVVCDLESSRMRRLWPTGGGGLLRQNNKIYISGRTLAMREFDVFTVVRCYAA